jgi:DNA-binding NarL/FixJ family response regulator
VIRIGLADDQVMIRSGLRMILESEPGFVVVGEASDGDEAVKMARRDRPDVILMDVRMPSMDGLEATRMVTERNADVHVIILTTFDLDDYVYKALRNGASGFLLKDAPADDLIAAVKIVADGGALLAPTVTRRLIAEFATRSSPGPTDDRLDRLTDREIEVLTHVSRGLSNTEVAEALYVSEATVKTHVSHILTKLELRDRVQAVVFAYESGLTQPGATDES